jgi:outer membrane protein assembly factor BamB
MVMSNKFLSLVNRLFPVSTGKVMLLMGSLLIASSANAQVFVHSLGDREFGTFNLTTLTYNQIGFTSVEMFDIAFDPSGNLFGISSGLDFYRINPLNAATTFVGSHNISAMNGLTFRRDGTLFAAATNGSLYTINTVTGSPTLLGSMSGFACAGDLAFDGSGNLYMTTTTNQLVRLNQSTGAATLIGNLNFTRVFGLAYDPDSDAMYGITDATGGRRFFQINLATGAGFNTLTYPTSINIGGGSFFRESVTVAAPEPTVAGLMLVGGIGLLQKRRKSVRLKAK